MLTLEGKTQFLSRAGIFESLRPNILAQVAARAGEDTVTRGTVLFREGTRGDTIYFVVDGEVEIYRGKGDHEVELATLKQNEVFGEMAALGQGVRTASARASSELRILFIKSKALRTLIAKVPNFAFAVFEVLVDRLTRANERILKGDLTPHREKAREVTRKLTLGPPTAEGLPEEDKNYLQFLRADCDIPDKDLHAVLRHLRAAVRMGEPARRLGEALLERGLLDEEQHQKLIRRINRQEAASMTAGPPEAEKEELLECPNCFEWIKRRSRSCRFCGVLFGKIDVHDTCTNCGHAQLPGGKYCRACGVSLETGRLPTQPVKKPCPRCGLKSSGMETICVVCGTPFDRLPILVSIQDAFKRVRKWTRAHSGMLFLAVLLIAVILVWRNWDSLVQTGRSLVYGDDLARVRTVAEEFINLIPYRDQASLRARMTPEASRRMESNPDRELARLWGREKEGETLLLLCIEDVRYEVFQCKAYLKATILIPPEGESSPGGGLDELGALLGTAKPKRREVQRFLVWTFRATASGDWYFHSCEHGQER